jgi:hypothetical protein
VWERQCFIELRISSAYGEKRSVMEEERKNGKNGIKKGKFL